MFSLSENGDLANEFVLYDEFFKLDTAATNGLWASVNDGATGTLAVVDRKGGWINVPTAAADNDYQYLTSAGEHFIFDTTSTVLFQAKVRLTEANTDDANIVIGLSDTVTAGIIANDGAGVASSFDGALWYKVDGGTVWQFATSNATAQVKNTSAATFTSGSDYVLGFLYSPMDAVTGKVQPFINGSFLTPHSITISGLEEMHAILGVKAGGSSAETLGIDYVYVRQSKR